MKNIFQAVLLIATIFGVYISIQPVYAAIPQGTSRIQLEFGNNVVNFNAGQANTSYATTINAYAYDSNNNQLNGGQALDPSDVRITATGLPPGLSFNSTTHQVTGTPTTQGTYQITVDAVLNLDSSITDHKVPNLVINPPAANQTSTPPPNQGGTITPSVQSSSSATITPPQQSASYPPYTGDDEGTGYTGKSPYLTPFAPDVNTLLKEAAIAAVIAAGIFFLF